MQSPTAVEARDLRFNEIVIDARFDVRQGFVDWGAVELYAGMAPADCPPGKVALFEGRYVLLAGRHRIEARKLQGLDYMTFEIYEASEAELYGIAAGDNTDAKVRYTTEQMQASVRRLIELGWSNSDISLQLGFGKHIVDKIKRVDASREMLGHIIGISDSHYHELYTAPEEHRDELARTVARKGYTVSETRTIVQGLRRNAYPDIVAKKIVRGEIEPFGVDEKTGEPQIDKATVTRLVGRRVRNDLYGQLLGVLMKFESWNNSYEDSDFDFAKVSPDRLQKLDEQLSRAAEQIGSIRFELVRMTDG